MTNSKQNITLQKTEEWYDESRMKNKIRYFRFLQNEMTQQQLAQKVGVTRQTIIAIEKGSFNPSVKLALKIAKVFSLSVEELFELEMND